MYIGGINIEKVSFSAATVEESFLYVCMLLLSLDVLYSI